MPQYLMRGAHADRMVHLMSQPCPRLRLCLRAMRITRIILQHLRVQMVACPAVKHTNGLPPCRETVAEPRVHSINRSGEWEHIEQAAIFNLVCPGPQHSRFGLATTCWCAQDGMANGTAGLALEWPGSVLHSKLARLYHRR